MLTAVGRLTVLCFVGRSRAASESRLLGGGGGAPPRVTPQLLTVAPLTTLLLSMETRLAERGKEIRQKESDWKLCQAKREGEVKVSVFSPSPIVTCTQPRTRHARPETH